MSIARNLPVRRALLMIAVLYAVAIVAPLLSPYDPLATSQALTLPPSLTHPFGTDEIGRDLFARVLYGARISLVLALVATTVSLAIGTAVGAFAGYAGGIVDAVLMRVVDAGLSIPRVFFVLVPLALWEQISLLSLVAALGFTGWFELSRLVRAQVASLNGRPFVSAARATGASGGRIIWRHLLPNAAGPIFVAATLGVAQVILIETGLSYLGLGVPEPMPSWGSLIAESRLYLRDAPWMALAPGLALVGTVLAFARLSDRLHAAFNPAAR